MLTPEPANDVNGTAHPAVEKATPNRSIVATWSEVLADASGLVQTEARLVRSETGDNLKAVGRQSAKMGAGILLMFLALIFLTVAGVVALAAYIGLLWALVTGAVLCLIVGLFLASNGLEGLRDQPILPMRTLHRMSTDLGRMADRAPLPDVEEDLRHASPEKRG